MDRPHLGLDECQELFTFRQVMMELIILIWGAFLKAEHIIRKYFICQMLFQNQIAIYIEDYILPASCTSDNYMNISGIDFYGYKL